ncbi:MAG: tetratricopeptide repeat protein [Limisphaerales bacterium]
MKRYFALLAALLLAAPLLPGYVSPDDEYIRIYNMIQGADALTQNAQLVAAYQQYQAAEDALKKLRIGSPGWNDKVVQFRLNYVAGKMAELAVKIPEGALAKPEVAKPTASKPPSAEELGKQVQALTEALQRMDADKSLLTMKLKEALSAQPAAVDPRELAKAEERIRSLQKENDLLQVSVEQQKAKVGNWIDPSVHAATEKALTEANRKLAEQTQNLAALTAAKAPAPQRAMSPVEKQRLEALRAENDILKRRVTDLEKKPAAAGKSKDSEQQLKDAKAEAVSQRDENAGLMRDKKSLEKELAGARKQVKANEESLAALRNKLAAASKKASRKNRSGATVEDRPAQDEVASLRARLAVLEAAKVPYTPEELALFKKADVKLTAESPAPGAEAKSSAAASPEPPPGAGPLLAEARRLSTNGRYAEAEKDYLQVLRMDENNPMTLANLASVQLEMGRLGEAEANLKRALAAAPNDPFNLYMQGALRYRQDKIEDALDALSRAAKLDPNKAVVQNLLGVVLIQKGLGDQAETAFRKAIQLYPEYAEAHMNLARVYAFHLPPLRELARWHYQKALDAGASKDSGLEKFFDEKPAPAEVK